MVGQLTCVVVAHDTGTPLGGRQLQGIRRCRRSANGHAKAEGESTTKEIRVVARNCLDNGADHDEDGAADHAGTAAEAIADGTREQRANHVANGVDHEDDARGLAELGVMEVGLVRIHGVDGAKDGLEFGLFLVTGSTWTKTGGKLTPSKPEATAFMAATKRMP